MTKRLPTAAQAQTAFTAQARRHAKAALAILVGLMASGKDERVRHASASRVLDLAWGRPGTAASPESAPVPVRLLPGDEKL